MDPMKDAKEDLLKHYRSCVKCHCNGEKAIKERVLPCGHASCQKVALFATCFTPRVAKTPKALLVFAAQQVMCEIRVVQTFSTD